jgi:endonuclease YncB( thermonuclease family)
MLHWTHRRYDERYQGWGRIQRSNIRALVVIVILACAAGYSAYRHWTGKDTFSYRSWTRHWRGTPPATIVGRAYVIDGDTVDIAGRRIRLEGIDAPESDQTCTDVRGQPWPCGRAATRELKLYLAGRELTCTSTALDRYRRVLAVCTVAGGTDINAWMVRQGWAVAYGFSSAYRSEQDEAQAGKRGIWAGTFTAPSEWRRRH